MRDTLSTMLVAILSLLSTEALAQDAETIADVRCLVIGTSLLASADPDQQSAGMTLSMYHIGRLDGRMPKLALEKLLIQESKIMNDSDYRSEGKRCGAGLKDKAHELARIGKDMREKAQKNAG
jgi:hypothetical protein